MVVTGGSGDLGTVLTPKLEARGDTLVAVTVGPGVVAAAVDAPRAQELGALGNKPEPPMATDVCLSSSATSPLDTHAGQQFADLSPGEGEARMRGFQLLHPLLQAFAQLHIGRGTVAFPVREDGLNIGLELLQEMALGSVRRLQLLQISM